jgi:hypothetical protein
MSNKKQSMAIFREIEKRREEERKLYRSRNAQYIGRFFMSEDDYGETSHGKTWWVYRRVTGITDDGRLTGWSFYTDCFGKSVINTEFDSSELQYSIEISAEKFYAAYYTLLDTIKALEAK